MNNYSQPIKTQIIKTKEAREKFFNCLSLDAKPSEETNNLREDYRRESIKLSSMIINDFEKIGL